MIFGGETLIFYFLFPESTLIFFWFESYLGAFKVVLVFAADLGLYLLTTGIFFELLNDLVPIEDFEFPLLLESSCIF
jgi:hypothetical protein